jgi:hypothetical protein
MTCHASSRPECLPTVWVRLHEGWGGLAAWLANQINPCCNELQAVINPLS